MNILPIGQRDQYLTKLQQDIKNKKMLLARKRREIKEKAKTNEYLQGIRGDYDRYYNHILHEKQQQYEALLLLREYVKDFAATERRVGEQLRSAKHDEKDIMSEIDKVKQDIDMLIGQND